MSKRLRFNGTVLPERSGSLPERIDDRIVIRCKDNGCGIPEDLQKTIFEPFITHKPGGTGLGLAVSKRIIEAHKGTLSFESKKGPGTTFTVSLPI